MAKSLSSAPALRVCVVCVRVVVTHVTAATNVGLGITEFDKRIEQANANGNCRTRPKQG